MPWLMNLVRRDDPKERAASPAVKARERKLLDLWSRHVEPVTGRGEGDYEHFYEQAVRLEAALDVFGADNIWLTIHSGATATNLGTGEQRAAAELSDLPRYGTQPSARHADVDMDQARLASAYYRYGAFLSRAGRRVELCGFATEEAPIEGPDAGELLAGFARDGMRLAFVKTTRVKMAAFPVSLHEGFTPEDAAHAFFAELGYGAMSLEGGSRNLIVQEYVPMEYEYRVFVVGQAAITAAGCIEEYTPLDNNGQRFDDRLRRHRRERSEVTIEPAVAETLTGFARDAVDALALEVPELRDYVMDVALAPDGTPLIVELNSLLNSGLYASRPELVAQALAAQHAEMPPLDVPAF